MSLHKGLARETTALAGIPRQLPLGSNSDSAGQSSSDSYISEVVSSATITMLTIGSRSVNCSVSQEFE